MDIKGLIIFIITGGVVGWLAGTFLKDKDWSIGLLGDIAVGIIGGVTGGLLFRLLVTASGGGIIVSIITATLGAIGLLYVIDLLKYRKESSVE
jgi:uncharacterized membrane protein YeaQ/YmgE (transglycosylase-associated protein family)